MTTIGHVDGKLSHTQRASQICLRVWIPGSALRAAPE